MTRSLLVAGVFFSVVFVEGCVGQPEAHPPGEPEAIPSSTPSFSMILADVGFAGPGSVLHDPAEDVYLVANANGGLMDRDGNGFISRVSPAGRILDLKWLDGSVPGVTLHAPRGMAILSDTLFVADIDCLRRFHRSTGQSFRETCLDPTSVPGDEGGDVVEKATALADVAATPWGDVFFSEVDSSLAVGAVYLMKSMAEVPQILATADGTLLEGDALGGPKGLASDEEGLLVATFGSGELFRVTTSGERIQLLEASELKLHGVLSLGDRGALVSSWGDSAVYRVAPDGSLSVVVSPVATPAAMGYDVSRGRLLIPLLATDQVLVLSIPPVPAGLEGPAGRYPVAPGGRTLARRAGLISPGRPDPGPAGGIDKSGPWGRAQPSRAQSRSLTQV